MEDAERIERLETQLAAVLVVLKAVIAAYSRQPEGTEAIRKAAHEAGLDAALIDALAPKPESWLDRLT